MVSYWNNIDSVIELNMDILDDPLGEAKEIHRFERVYRFKYWYLSCASSPSPSICNTISHSVNSWLTYGEPLHRLREFGITLKEMDVIDEKPLSMEQMKMVCACMRV